MTPMSDNDKREIAKRDTDPYPTDIKAEAVALVYESGNFSEATRVMAGRYPDRHPARQLIARWFKQVDPETFAALFTERKEAFETGLIELADKAREKLYEALDDMTPGQVPIPAGIAMDKGLKLLEIESRNRGGANRFALIKMMAKMEQAIADGTGIISAEAILLEGEMP